jgi:very-short-patch-repair endonuclease
VFVGVDAACGQQQRKEGESRQSPPVPTPPVPPRVRRPTNRRRARAEGISDWQLRHDEVVRTSRDTYLPRTASKDLRQRVAAVLMGAPKTAVVSHFTAAALWGLEIPLVPDDGLVHLTVPASKRARNRDDRKIHSADLPEPEIRRRGGIRLTSPGRTWLDLAGLIPAGALLAVTDQMLGRTFPREAFDRLRAESRGARGVRTARRVVAAADGRAGSPMESVLRWLVLEAGLPAPDLQHVITRDGQFVGKVDLAWAGAKVLVEFDGNVHRERKVFVDDLRRQNGLVLAGWTVLRFTSADVLGRPQWVISMIRAALAGL